MIESHQVEATHVIIGGVVFPWASKFPYVDSGRSILGGIEYNQKADLIRCHKCGCWFRSLALHVRKQEGLGTREYRTQHGLAQTSALNVPSIVRAHKTTAKKLSRKFKHNISSGAHNKGVPASLSSIQRGRQGCAEINNLRMICAAQLKNRIMLLAFRVNGTPTKEDLYKERLHRRTLMHAFGVPVATLFKSLGLSLNRRAKGERITRQPLPAHIRAMHKSYTTAIGVQAP